jgi:F420H(2)-dependent quinone reductase
MIGKSIARTWMNKAFHVFTKIHVNLYEKSGGVVGGAFPNGTRVLLLTTLGQVSGKRRTCPLLYMGDGEKIILVASKGGHPTHPLWYRNLVKNPEVEVQTGHVCRAMIAKTADPPEREYYWPKLSEMHPTFQRYQERTQREIPVVILQPRL